MIFALNLFFFFFFNSFLLPLLFFSPLVYFASAPAPVDQVFLSGFAPVKTQDRKLALPSLGSRSLLTAIVHCLCGN